MSTVIARNDGTHGSPLASTTILQLLCDGAFQRRARTRAGSRLAIEEVVIDCCGVGLVSSEDLNALIRFHSRLRQESAALVLVNVPETVAQVFTLTRLDRLFDVQETLLPS